MHFSAYRMTCAVDKLVTISALGDVIARYVIDLVPMHNTIAADSFGDIGKRGVACATHHLKNVDVFCGTDSPQIQSRLCQRKWHCMACFA